ncbi:MAG TPA: type II toxin-antitoxin system prevent-host-death family antitoxin [Thermoanaerobaculia bacterium]|nr:type II toxin-antitoxin system prevent-host-death family antitoxin [Thermoanaerobaculia bacterium]
MECGDGESPLSNIRNGECAKIRKGRLAVAALHGNIAARPNPAYSASVQITMPTETTYTHARANLKALLDEASDSREPVIIRRREGGDVALIAVDELRSLMEVAHLLRSPRNAERLFRALARVKQGKGRPESLEKLRRDVGLDD